MAHTRVTISLDTDTKAFQCWESEPDGWQRNIARNEQVGLILKSLVERIYNSDAASFSEAIKDTNGEIAGHFEFIIANAPRAIVAHMREEAGGQPTFGACGRVGCTDCRPFFDSHSEVKA